VHLPTVSVLFAAFLGFNPGQHLIGAHALAGLSAHNRALLLGHRFFPSLISAPFRAGLHEAFTFAIVACILGAGASLMRGTSRKTKEPAGEVRAARAEADATATSLS